MSTELWAIIAAAVAAVVGAVLGSRKGRQDAERRQAEYEQRARDHARKAQQQVDAMGPDDLFGASDDWVRDRKR